MTKTLYKGKVLDLTLEAVRLPNRKVVNLEMIRHPGAAAVVPVRDDGRIVMIRQYRHAAGGMIYEIPAGRLDGGEAPLDCAKRELREEAGYEANRWLKLGAIFTTPGFTDEKIHLFLAQELTQVPQDLEADEVIEVEEHPLESLIGMVTRGDLVDGKTICALTLAYFHLKGVSE